MKHIGFDHCYTEDKRHKFLKALGKAGFVLAENEVEHPGKQFCRFIMFRRGAGFNYLEFVNVGSGGKRIDKPGISLRYEGALKEYFQSIKGRKGVKAKFIHKNFDWKKDSKSILPGWNFVTFLRPAFKNIYPWFTEYESRPGKKRKRMRPLPHPNTAQAIAGLEMTVRKPDRPRLERIFGKDFRGDDVSLGDFRLFINHGRSSSITALIIKCKDLDCFVKVSKMGEKIVWRGQDAVLIKNPIRGMWDILVVE